MRQSGQLEIVGKPALAGQETKILLAPHRLTDTVRDGTRRVHTIYSDENCHVPRRVIRSASHLGTCPPCSGRLAVPAL
jgi:hypothetical protein